MWFHSWFCERDTLSYTARHRRARGRPRPTGARLRVERLEERTLLSTGALDPTFGTGGLVTTDFGGDGDVARAVVLQAHGKIVVAGEAYGASTYLDFALARYNADGSPDPTFGSGGRVTTNFGGFSMDRLYAVAIYPLSDPLNGGKIVAAGSTDLNGRHDFALARYNADGSLDPTFGTGGKVITDFSGDGDYAHAVTLQSDGKIVVAGETTSGTGNHDFGLARYNADGSLDPTFGTGGKVTTDFFRDVDSASGLALQADGKIMVAGFASRPLAYTSTSDFALARYDTSGNLDATFGSGGKVTTDFGSTTAWAKANSLALQIDGKIVLAGSAYGGRTQRSDFALTRYNPNGSLDSTFGKRGKVTTDFGSAEDSGSGVGLQTVGGQLKIVVAGSTWNSSGSQDFALARYNANGSLDAGFGNGGKVTTDIGTSHQAATDVAIQADGKIVAAGNTRNPSTGTDFALARYLGDAPASPLQVQSGVAPGQANRETLTAEQVQPLLTEALARWQFAGVDTSGLTDINIQIADLGGATLGLASGHTIWLDDNAAGWGWFVDPTPRDDSEFNTPGDQGEQDRMDLLSVLMHEMGHLLGHEHGEPGASATGDVMAETLTAGTRLTLLDAAFSDADWLLGLPELTKKRDRFVG